MIERLEDRVLLTTFTVTSTGDTVDGLDGQTTLREAIIEANATAGLDTIQFDIGPAGSAQTISLASSLTTITDAVTIDGSTQGGGLTIDAAAVSGNVLGIGTGGDGSTVKNLTIANAAATAVFVANANGNTFENLDLSWNDPMAKSGTGLYLNASDNNTVHNVTAINRENGIAVVNSDINVIDQNTVTGASKAGIRSFGTANGNTYSNNNASGSKEGIYSSAVGLGNTYENNDLSNSTVWALRINNDTDFSVTGIGLQLSSVTNSTIKDLDLSWTGISAATSGTGLYLNASDGNTVKNVTAINRATGIQLKAASHNLVEHNDVRLAGKSGIGITGVSDDNMFEANDASWSNVGIKYFSTGSGNSYVDNILSNTRGRGLAILNDSEFVATGNIFTGSRDGMWLGSMENLELTAASTTFDIDVSSVDRYGLTLVNISGNSIVDGLDLSYTGVAASGTGFQLWNSDGITVQNVTANNRAVGLNLLGGEGNTFADNTATGASISGIKIQGTTSGNTFNNNNVSGASGYGIQMQGTATGNTLSNNNASGSSVGIWSFSSGLGNSYVDNNLSQTTNWGLKISNDTEFVITGNDFTGSRHGVWLYKMDGVTLSSSTTAAGTLLPVLDIDVSTVTGTALRLSTVTDSNIDGFDLSYAGGTASGTGLHLLQTDTMTVSNVTVGNRGTGIELNNADNTAIHCAQFVGNDVGLLVWNDTSDVKVWESQIEGNGNGIDNNTSIEVNAENNYWGAADGPSNLMGSGDGYTGLVDADPFLASLPGCLVTNVAPEVAADATSVTVDEGDPAGDVVSLSASSGSVINNGDGTWTWSASTDDGPADGTAVTISADDGNGGTVDTNFTLVVDNVVPTASVDTAPASGLEGDLLGFTFSAGDVSSADELAGFDYAIDWDGDGTVDETINDVVGSLNVDHTFTAS